MPEPKARWGATAAVLVAATLQAQGAPAVKPVEPGGAPAGPPAQPVEETYFGTKVTDRFRFMEAKDPATIAWMKSQGAYARSVFDSIGPRAEYLRKLSELGASFGFARSVQVTRNRLFYLERKPGSDVYDLVV
ncbi:MAG TPA: hypothetical protein VGY49_09005, partial [Burkholderiaceae bacterium]|nr:hypothetical protein [Burkholderiaceae bacterium]